MAKFKGPSRKYFFVSYSSRPPQWEQSNLLLSLLWIVFSEQFDLKVTPSSLQSGASQLDQIYRLAKDCAFAVVVLDGLRPNVVFEYGLLKGFGRPIILLKEENSVVDIQGFLMAKQGSNPNTQSIPTPAPPAPTRQLETANPRLDVDSHFSNIKDQNYATWDASDPAKTAKLLWEEYQKKQNEIVDNIRVKEPRLW